MRMGLLRTDGKRRHDTIVTIGIGVAVVVLALLVGLFVETWRSSRLTIGIVLEEQDEEVLVVAVDADAPAEQAGLREGDVLLSISGRSIRSIVDYDVAAADFRPDEAAVYTVVREDQTLAFEVRPGVPFPLARFSATTAAVLLYLLLGLGVLLERSTSLRGRLLTVLALSVAIELALPASQVGRPLLGAALMATFGLLAGLQYGVELHLAALIPQRHPWLERRPWVVPCFYATGLALGLVLFGSSVPGLDDSPLFAWALSDAGILLIDAIYVLWPLGILTMLGAAAFKWPTPVGRHQATLVLLGCVPWVVLSIYSIGAYYVGATLPSQFELVEAVALMCFPVAIFSAIYRYRLFDLELVVRRSLVYTTLTATLVLVFLLAVWAGGSLASGFVEEQRVMAWIVGGAMLALGLLFAPLRDFLQTQIEVRFFPERRVLRESLIALARDLPAQGTIEAMGEKLSEELCSAFDARSALLFLSDPKSGVLVRQGEGSGDLPRLRSGLQAGDTAAFLLPVEQMGIQVIGASGRPMALSDLGVVDPQIIEQLKDDVGGLLVPLLRHDQMVGLVALGQKRSGSEYSGEEQELLALVAHHVGAVFENARLFESATLDGLTGLNRRDPILDIVDREMRRALRYERPLTLGMADIDGFKYINDIHGHLAGDRLLRRVAKVLRSSLRASDAVGRYGGDEFLVLLPETDSGAALGVAEKVRARVERLRIQMESGIVLQATLSIGLASLRDLEGVHGLTTSTLIGMADEALYRAKREGRNRVRLPDPPMRALS